MLTQKLFDEMASQWKRETRHLSSINAIAMHPDYQRIISFGPEALPFICRSLKKKPDHWFWALAAITGENPVREEDAGDIDKMMKAWLELAYERGWISK